MTKTLSICIPTLNRVKCLRNCLESIYQSKKNSKISFEVCISDNASKENTSEVVNEYINKIDIKFNINKENLGLGANILKSVEMARGEFVWIIGNDDMLMKNTLEKLKNLFTKHSNVDYYYINTFHLSSEYVFKHDQPFDHRYLPKKMKKFTLINNDKKCNYFELINPNYAFDFLLGQFLSIFRRDQWIKNLSEIDNNQIQDRNNMSNIYVTFPHCIIFAKAFRHSKAFFHAEPLSIALYGEREWWDDLYPFVESVRIPELVDVYRKNGLSFFKYLRCKNFALRKLIPNLFKIFFLKNYNGSNYINFKKHILFNLFFPSIYYGSIFFLMRKIFKVILRTK